MISFIVIGRNESLNITRCIKSIFNYCQENNISHYEILYVDSDSSDDTVDRVLAFNRVKVIKITGDINASVARNVGAKHSIGNILFFIDGDMEIEAAFYSVAIDGNGDLIYDFISGEFIDYYYDNYGNLINKDRYFKIAADRFEVTTGGIFMIKRSCWKLLNGMKNKYRRCQDLDFGLRMSLAGTKLFRKCEIICSHHTISYYDDLRLWKDLFNGNQMYQKSVLYRDHIFNPAIYNLIKREVSLIALIVSIFLSILYTSYFLFLFIMLVFFKSVYKSKNGVSKNFSKRFFYYGLLDIIVLIGLFLFWPSNKNIYTVNQLN